MIYHLIRIAEHQEALEGGGVMRGIKIIIEMVDKKLQEVINYLINYLKEPEGHDPADVCPDCNTSDTQSGTLKDEYRDNRLCSNCGLEYEYEHMIGAMGEHAVILKKFNVAPVNEYTISQQEHALRSLEADNERLEAENKRMRELLEEAQEEIQNCYGRDIELTERITEVLEGRRGVR